MLAKISSRLELIFLDIFIYVLSDTKWFRMIVRGFYTITNNRQQLHQFIYICFVFGLIGLSLGWLLSVLLSRTGFMGIF